MDRLFPQTINSQKDLGFLLHKPVPISNAASKEPSVNLCVVSDGKHPESER